MLHNYCYKLKLRKMKFDFDKKAFSVEFPVKMKLASVWDSAVYMTIPPSMVKTCNKAAHVYELLNRSIILNWWSNSDVRTEKFSFAKPYLPSNVTGSWIKRQEFH